MAEVKTYVDDNRQPVEDREFRKFRADKDGDVAVNIVGQVSLDPDSLIELENITVNIANEVEIKNDSGSPVPVVFTEPNTTTTIFNLDCPVIDAEYSQALPSNTKKFLVKARKNSKIKFAYSASATNYLTIESGVSFVDENFYTSKTLYFRCSKADEVVEVVAYV